MKTSPSDWVEWDDKEVLPFEGGISFQVRTVKPCIIKNEFGLILGFGSGQQEVVVTGQGEISFSCASAIWLRPFSRVQERLQRSTEIFTSLDRPSPLTPEMQAIHRMMRRNEIDRELDRREMEKRFADRSRENARSELGDDAPEAFSAKKEKVRKNPERSVVDTEDETFASSEDASSSGISGSETKPDKGSATDS